MQCCWGNGGPWAHSLVVERVWPGARGRHCDEPGVLWEGT